MIHSIAKIYSSIPVLFSQGVMRLTAARMQLDQLKVKAPREFNRRVKERMTEREPVLIEAVPIIDPPILPNNATQRILTREQFEAEYA